MKNSIRIIGIALLIFFLISAPDSVRASSPEKQPEAEEHMEGEDITLEVQNTGYQGKASDDSGNFANLVVFVEFADTKHDHILSNWGQCYLKDPNLTALFQGDDTHPRAMKKYLQKISYNQFEVANIFPQYDEATNTIHPYVLKNNADYYAGGMSGDTAIIEEISSVLASSNQIDASISLDRDGDGYVDNLMIVVPCESGNSNNKYYGHKGSYDGYSAVNSKRLTNYTMVTESEAYLSTGQSGVLIHEFLHTLGYLDLYTQNNQNKIAPVGEWDIMGKANMAVQYPLAYFRSICSNWFTIPTVMNSQQGYSLYAASETTEATKNNQAVILKTDYSPSEFFVLEYRKKGGDVIEEKQKYECSLPGSGLIIYRVNTAYAGGNISGPPYMVYVFRSGDTYDTNGYEKADQDLLNTTSFFSMESGRTAFGSSDANAGLSENAITYSDGTNSGIVISNIGSAEGEQITFDITFAEENNNSKWKLETEDTTGIALSEIDSCRTESGEVYYIAQVGQQNANVSALLEYNAGVWSKLADGPQGTNFRIAEYNKEIYVTYLDASYHVKLDKWNGSGWVNLFSSEVPSYEFTVSSSDRGVYLVFANKDGNIVYAYRYSSGGGVKSLGNQVGSSSRTQVLGNVMISEQEGSVVAAYRDTSNVYIKKYDEKTDSWSSLLDGTMQANRADVRQNGSLLYFLKNGTTWGKNESYLYVYDMNEANGQWTPVGTNMVMNLNVSEMKICFNGSTPYVIYTKGGDTKGETRVMVLEDDEWTQLGEEVSRQYLKGLNSYFHEGKIYITYLMPQTGRINIRSMGVSGEGDTPQEPPENIPITSVTLNKKSCTLNTGQSVLLTATIQPDNTTESKKLTWSSSNKAIAEVDSNGNVKAVKPGSVTITVKSVNGKEALCSINVVNPVSEGWKKDSVGYWYRYPNGTYPYSQWKKIDGAWYYFNSSGYRVTGWKMLGGIWYFMQSDGKMVTGARTIGGKDYYFTSSGAMVKGWQSRNGSWYYYSSSGAMVKSAWQQLGGTWYFMQSDGKMVTGTRTIGGKDYYFTSSGAMVRGWQWRNGSWYYYSSSGAMVKGRWQLVGGGWYYLKKDGRMAVNEWIGNCYVNASGKWV